MTVEICSSKPTAVDFTFNSKPLFVRQMPLQLGLKVQSLEDGGSVAPEIVADIISQCVVDAKGKAVWSSADVLGFDLKPMLEIFAEVSGRSTIEEAKKN